MIEREVREKMFWTVSITRANRTTCVIFRYLRDPCAFSVESYLSNTVQSVQNNGRQKRTIVVNGAVHKAMPGRRRHKYSQALAGCPFN